MSLQPTLLKRICESGQVHFDNAYPIPELQQLGGLVAAGLVRVSADNAYGMQGGMRSCPAYLVATPTDKGLAQYQRG